MNRIETTNLLEKIQVYRQSFLITPSVISEWSRILESYDYEDVNQKLDEYFKNGDNFGRYPDVYYLIKYLKKHDEKLKVGVNYVRCQNCQQIVELTQYDKHIDRCNSINYLCDMSEKYYKKRLSREILLKMTDEEFDKGYWSFCEKLYEIMTDEVMKHALKNAILTHDGLKPELNISDVIKEVQKRK